MPEPFFGQSYSVLKKKSQKTDILFTDSLFKPSAQSLSATAEKYGQIQWKRPQEIANASPVLRVADVTGDNMTNGPYGAHTFLAACSCLSTYKANWQRVIPNIKEQDWDPQAPKKYAGIFHFSIWHGGQWQDVVVDDLLPTRDGHLVFSHEPNNQDFWLPLLEKAYAKVLGSYESLEEADLLEVLEDFTGGLSEFYDIATDDDSQERLFRTLKEETENKTLVSAIIAPPTYSSIDKEMNLGLVIGHGYGVTALRRVTLTGTNLVKLTQAEKVNLIRLRDPWSTDGWTGKFGHGSEEWKECTATAAIQKKLGLTLDVVNEFWMTFDDFCSNFTNLVMCRTMKNKNFAAIKSEWAEPNMAGGSIDNPDTFLSNPQIVFTVTEREDEMVLCLLQTAPVVKRKQVASIVDLPAIISTAPSQLTDTGLPSGQPSQLTNTGLPSGQPSQITEKSDLTENNQTAKKDHLTENNQSAETNQLSIHTEHSHTSENTQLTETNQKAESGLTVGQLETSVQRTDVTAPISYTARLGETPWTIQSHRHKLLVGFSLLKVEENRTYRLHRMTEVVTTSEFAKTRRVVLRQWLPKGRYIVVATTKRPHEAGTFILNIYSSHSCGASELDKDKPKVGMFSKSCTCIPFLRQPTLLTQVVVVKATGLEQTRAEPNLYCVSYCEGHKVTTPVCKNTLTPQWNTGAVFYRRKPSAPIKVQLWTQNLLAPSFLGEVILEGRHEVEDEVINWPLYDRKDLTQRKPGYLTLRVTVTTNLQGI